MKRKNDNFRDTLYEYANRNGTTKPFKDQERKHPILPFIWIRIDQSKSEWKMHWTRWLFEEKVKMIHAQSKFSSAGVPRPRNSPKYGLPTVLTVSVRKCCWDEWDLAGWTNDSCIASSGTDCLAATWNPEMSHLYRKSIGEEARYRKKALSC